MENRISIPNPCSENWNSMKSNEKGKFCMSCNKTVVDFTKMKNPEIQKYFVENSGSEKICGHFKINQIESNSDYSKFKNRFNRIPIKPIKILALLSLTAVFSLSSCIMGKRAEVDGEPASVNTDSIHESEIKNKLQNEEKKTDSLKIEEKSIKVKK